MLHLRKFCPTNQVYVSIFFTFCNISVRIYNKEYITMNSNKDILDRAIGRPAMMAFIILVGTYVTTGQLIPGVF